LRPPENFLLYHLEQPLSVYRRDVDLGLKPSYFVRPGHRLANQTVGSELHQRLIYCVKDALVENVHRFRNLLLFLVYF
jgi:hypothetical protein